MSVNNSMINSLETYPMANGLILRYWTSERDIVSSSAMQKWTPNSYIINRETHVRFETIAPDVNTFANSDSREWHWQFPASTPQLFSNNADRFLDAVKNSATSSFTPSLVFYKHGLSCCSLTEAASYHVGAINRGDRKIFSFPSDRQGPLQSVPPRC